MCATRNEVTNNYDIGVLLYTYNQFLSIIIRLSKFCQSRYLLLIGVTNQIAN